MTLPLGVHIYFHVMLVASFFAVSIISANDASTVTANVQVSATCLYRHKPRVRREWRSLDETTKLKVAKAFWIVKNVSTQQGRQLYGKHFTNHDDMVMFHVCAVLDPRCDQGHFGPQFMTFHRLLLLKYELALLSVDPSIGAMPYWNMAYDSVGGKFYKDSLKWIFSDNYFGAFQGTGINHSLMDGLFANWPVAEYSRERFGNSSALAVQHTKYGSVLNTCIQQEWFKPPQTRCSLLRNHDDCTRVVARQPNDPSGQSVGGIHNLIPMNASKGMGGDFGIVFTDDDFNACIDPDKVATWMDWQNCVELSAVRCLSQKGRSLLAGVLQNLITSLPKNQTKPMGASARRSTIYYLDQLQKDPDWQRKCGKDPMLVGYFTQLRKSALRGSFDYGNNDEHLRGFVNFFHSQAHFKMGRDMLDVATSPNDPGVFTAYHADIDRSNMHWMMASQLQVMNWTYPPSEDAALGGKAPYGASGPYSRYDKTMCKTSLTFPWVSGTLYDDVVNAGFPFFDIFACSSTESCDGGLKGYTHADVLWWTSPERTPYTYDTLEHLYC